MENKTGNRIPPEKGRRCKVNLNTNQHCFICLQNIFCTDEADHKIFSLQTLFTCLKVDPQKVIRSVGNPSLLKTIGANSQKDKLDFRVSLCLACRKTVQRASEQFLRLEIAQMELEFSLSRIHNEIAKTKEQNYNKLISKDENSIAVLVLVDELRKNILKQASKMKFGDQPILKLNRILPVELNRCKKRKISTEEAPILLSSSTVKHAEKVSPLPLPSSKAEENKSLSSAEISTSVSAPVPKPKLGSPKSSRSTNKTKTKMYKSTSCSNISNRPKVKRHYDKLHLNVTFRCKLCQKCFSSKEKIKKHIQKEHSEEVQKHASEKLKTHLEPYSFQKNQSEPKSISLKSPKPGSESSTASVTVPPAEENHSQNAPTEILKSLLASASSTTTQSGAFAEKSAAVTETDAEELRKNLLDTDNDEPNSNKCQDQQNHEDCQSPLEQVLHENEVEIIAEINPSYPPSHLENVPEQQPTHSSETTSNSDRQLNENTIPAVSSKSVDKIWIPPGGAAASTLNTSEAASTSNTSAPKFDVNERITYNEEKKMFECLDCGKEYSNKHSAQRHYRVFHLRIRHTCKFCGQNYTQNFLLTRHMKICTKSQAVFSDLEKLPSQPNDKCKFLSITPIVRNHLAKAAAAAVAATPSSCTGNESHPHNVASTNVNPLLGNRITDSLFISGHNATEFNNPPAPPHVLDSGKNVTEPVAVPNILRSYRDKIQFHSEALQDDITRTTATLSGFGSKSQPNIMQQNQASTSAYCSTTAARNPTSSKNIIIVNDSLVDYSNFESENDDPLPLEVSRLDNLVENETQLLNSNADSNRTTSNSDPLDSENFMHFLHSSIASLTSSEKVFPENNDFVDESVDNTEPEPFELPPVEAFLGSHQDQQMHPQSHSTVYPEEITILSDSDTAQQQQPLSSSVEITGKSQIAQAPAEIKQFQCSACGKDYFSRQSLKYHFNTVHLLIKHTCKLCNQSFSQWKLRKHICEGPSTSTTIPSTEVGVNAPPLAPLQQSDNVGHINHINRAEVSVQPVNELPMESQSNYGCELCGKTFSDSILLMRHRQTVKPCGYQCEGCGEIYRNYLHSTHVKYCREYLSLLERRKNNEQV